MSTIDQTIRRADHLRRSPARVGGERGHKEWMHFCVYGPEVDVLVNFSLVDDVRPEAAPGDEFARVVVLVRDGAWDGDVERFEADVVRAQGGGLSLRFGDNVMRYEDGAYTLAVTLTRRPITVRLRLTARCVPSLANNIQLDPGPPIHWLVLPRCTADGEVVVAGRRHTFVDAPAYHDHNWGRFAWGRDFAWEWGFGLPPSQDNPWTLVFVRLSNRAHTRALMQAVFLWRGPWQQRVFRGGDVAVAREGFLRPARVFKVPRPMALLSPGTATDVPKRLVMRAAGDGDRVEVVFDADDLAQVIIPNDHDPGVTIIHEVSGRVTVEGAVLGERVAMEGRAIFEFLGA